MAELDDLLDEASGKTDAAAATDPTKQVRAVDWNAVVEALQEVRGLLLETDAGYARMAGRLLVGPSSGEPSNPFHVVGASLMEGSVTIKSASEPALDYLRTGDLGGYTNARWQSGRIYATPFGPAYAILFSADGVDERRVFSLEHTGTWATILDDARRAWAENYDVRGARYPWMRINRDTMAVEWGPGARLAEAGNVVRASDVLTVTFNRAHEFSVDDVMYVDPNTAHPFLPQGLVGTISAVDGNTVTIPNEGEDGTSEVDLVFSSNTQAHLKWYARNALRVTLGGGTKVDFNPGDLTLASGYKLILGGGMREGIWVHSGDQTFTNERYMDVDASSGNRTETLPSAGGRNGQAHQVKKTDSGANTVTVATTSGQTIDGASSVVLTDQWDWVDVYSDGSNWKVRSKQVGGAAGASGPDLTEQLYNSFFGTGADGALTMGASGVTTLTRDVYYTDLNWPSGSSAQIDTANFRIFVSGTLDLTNAPAGAIKCNGNGGGNATVNAGGAGGTARAAGIFGASGAGAGGGNGLATNGATPSNPTPVSPYAGGGRFGTPNGGVGGAGASGTGGNGGPVNQGAVGIGTGYATPLPHLYGLSALAGGNGGSGGGGGGGDGSSGGGGGGGGGGAGVAAVFARTLVTGSSTGAGTIRCNGGNGGNGGVPSGGSRGGGGGAMAGAGGWVYVVAGEKTGPTITGLLMANSGVGGGGGNATGTGTGGTGGGTMQAGRITLIRLDDGTLTEVLPAGGTLAGDGPSGGTGGAGAAAATATVDV